MAVLEIELKLPGFKDGTGDVNSFSSAISNLDSQIAKASANSMQLERDLLALNKSYASGAISQSEYNKEQREISVALTETRSALSSLQSQKASYASSLVNENKLLITANSSYNEVQKRLSQVGKEIKSTTGAFSSQSVSLQNSIKEYNDLNNKLKAFDSTLGNNQRKVGDYAGALKGSAQIGVEFTRVIQDAPYGIQGVANNLQQLTQNYANYANGVRSAAAAQGATVSNMAIFKGALKGMMSPMVLLTVGVSALTAAWSYYTIWQQKSAKATKEASKDFKKSNDDYIASLNQTDQARIKGTISAQRELITLKTLYSVYTDSSVPLDKRKGAYQEMQRLYPNYFKNIKFEQESLGKVKLAYEKLTDAILAKSRAEAAGGLIEENSKRQLTNEQKLLDLGKQKAKQQMLVTKLTKEEAANAGAAERGDASGLNITLDLIKARKELVLLQKQEADIKTDSNILDSRNQELLKSIKDNTITSSNEVEKAIKAKKKEVDYLEKIQELNRKGENKAEVSGETGVEKEIAQVENFYEGLYVSLANYQAEYQKKYAVGTEKRKELDAKYAESVILLNEGMYNAISKIVGAENAKRITEATEAAQKELEARTSILSKIEDIQNTVFTGDKKEVDKQLDKTIEQLRKAYEAYEKVLNLQGKDTSGIEGLFKTAVLNIEANAKPTENTKTDDKYMDRAVKNAISGALNKSIEAFSNLSAKSIDIEKKYNDLRQNGTTQQIALYNQLEKLEKSMATSLIANITTVFSSITQGFNDVLVKGFAESVSKMVNSSEFQIGTLSNKTSQALVAGASMAGGLISSLTNKTSAAGQGIGGGLSGAATGLGIGSMLTKTLGENAGIWGAAIGGVIGIIGGIFGAKKAKEQEKLQKQQVELQRQQLEEQKRANALAYTSSIIGQMTNQGIVTGVDRNEFGDIQFRIDGRDLVTVTNRNLTASNRGA